MSARVLVLDWPAAEATLVEWAHAYSRAGLRVLPLAARSKIPATLHGVHDASSDHEQLAAWWTRWPDANIGIACGDGLVVLDIDGRHDGHASFDRLMTQHRIPYSPLAATGSGDGLHVYLNDPTGRVRSSAGKLGDGIDVLADGRYVVAPPSVHPAGGQYVWTKSARGGVPDMPLSLIDVLAPTPVIRTPSAAPRTVSRAARGGIPTPYGRATLDALIAKVQAATPGSRHDTLFRAAARAGDLAGERHLDAGAAFDELLDAGRQAYGGEETDEQIARVVHDAMLRARQHA